ncbi:hypothetical protein P154DRAFT_400866, partial [Amniculicola lignicola CBS 123094]
RNVKQAVTAETEFVIHARDNNKPNPFGTHSSTSGPLSYGEVARLFQECFGGNSKAPAMEKRYRQMRARYIEEHPDYPREIVYASAPVRVKKCRRSAKTSRAPQTKAMPSDDALLPDHTDQQPTHEELDCPEPAREQKAHWAGYSHMCGPISDECQPEFVIIDLLNQNERRVGRCSVPLRHLRRSSAIAAEVLYDHQSMTIKIQNTSTRAVERYIQSISPVQRSELPTHDFTIGKNFKDECGLCSGSVVTTIKWNFRSLAELYTIAAQLMDDHVRNLVVDRWIELCHDGFEFELDDMNNLWHNTDDDPARVLVADIMHSSGIKIEANDAWHSTLVSML